jgi:erythromycin esterase-like protein
MRTTAILLAALLAACASGRTADEASIVAAHARVIEGKPSDYDPLLHAIGGASLVLLGESTHGTREFYVERSRITRRLVEEKAFTVVAIEGEWSAAARVDRYVRGEGSDRSAAEALGGFTRFPRWVWRNAEFAALVESLRQWNEQLPAGTPKARITGIDLQFPGDAVAEVVDRLQRVDAALAASARNRYACLEKYRGDFAEYGRAVAMRRAPSCAAAVQEQLAEISARLDSALPGSAGLEPLIEAEQAALVLRNGEEYYREAFAGRLSAWNLRDRHMTDALARLQTRLVKSFGTGKIAVWAHNTHVGDARATSQRHTGEWSVGQLARELWPPGATFLAGFTTASGEVLAASDVGAEGEVKTLNPPIAGSHASVFSSAGIPRFYFLPGAMEEGILERERPQRVIGVVYRPATERTTHYITASIRRQFDAVVHIEATSAVRPL